jgi:hypothetical protein
MSIDKKSPIWVRRIDVLNPNSILNGQKGANGIRKQKKICFQKRSIRGTIFNNYSLTISGKPRPNKPLRKRRRQLPHYV